MKFATILAVALTTAMCSSASLDVKLEYSDGWKVTPAVVVPGPTLSNFLGVKNLNPQLFGLVGVETPTDRFSLAGGLRFPTKISDNLTANVGPWVVFQDGQRPRIGLFLGFSLN